MARVEPFSHNLWLVEGSVVSFYGFPYPTRMVLVRLQDGGLWVWSPIELDDALSSELDSLGEVRWIVTPNKIHHLFLEPWCRRWPDARCFAPPGLADKRPDLVFEGELAEQPPAAWAGQIDQLVVPGSSLMVELIFFHRESATCIVGDLIQRHEASTQHGLRGQIMKAWGLVGARGSTPREWRASFVRRAAARRALRAALDWRPEALVIAHGTCAREGGAAVLAQGLRWLDRPWPL